MRLRSGASSQPARLTANPGQPTPAPTAVPETTREEAQDRTPTPTLPDATTTTELVGSLAAEQGTGAQNSAAEEQETDPTTEPYLSEEEEDMGEKWVFTGEPGGMTFVSFKLKLTSELNQDNRRLPRLAVGDVVTAAERDLADFMSIPRFLSGTALTRYQQDHERLLADVVTVGDSAADIALVAAEAALRGIQNAATDPPSADYYAALGAAMAKVAETTAKATKAKTTVRRPDLVGRLMTLWKQYYPDNTAENQAKYAEFQYVEGESPADVFVRLQQITEQLKVQLGDNAINNPETKKKYRNVIRVISPDMYKTYCDRVWEDDKVGKVSTLREISDEVQMKWISMRRLEMEDGSWKTPRIKGANFGNKPPRNPNPSPVLGRRSAPEQGYTAQGAQSRLCFQCGQPGHVARDCPAQAKRGRNPGVRDGEAPPLPPYNPNQRPMGFLPKPPPGNWVVSPTGVSILSKLPKIRLPTPKPAFTRLYSTKDAVCGACTGTHHTHAQCFRVHGYPKEYQPYLLPPDSATYQTPSTQTPRYTPSPPAYTAQSPVEDGRILRLEGHIAQLMHEVRAKGRPPPVAQVNTLSLQPTPYDTAYAWQWAPMPPNPLITEVFPDTQPNPSSEQGPNWQGGAPGFMVNFARSTPRVQRDTPARRGEGRRDNVVCGEAPAQARSDGDWRKGQDNPETIPVSARRMKRAERHRQFILAKANTVGITDHRRSARPDTESRRRDVTSRQRDVEEQTRLKDLRGSRLPRTFIPQQVVLNPTVGIGLGPVSMEDAARTAASAKVLPPMQADCTVTDKETPKHLSPVAVPTVETEQIRRHSPADVGGMRIRVFHERAQQRAVDPEYQPSHVDGKRIRVELTGNGTGRAHQLNVPNPTLMHPDSYQQRLTRPRIYERMTPPTIKEVSEQIPVDPTGGTKGLYGPTKGRSLEVTARVNAGGTKAHYDPNKGRSLVDTAQTEGTKGLYDPTKGRSLEVTAQCAGGTKAHYDPTEGRSLVDTAQGNAEGNRSPNELKSLTTPRGKTPDVRNKSGIRRFTEAKPPSNTTQLTEQTAAHNTPHPKRTDVDSLLIDGVRSLPGADPWEDVTLKVRDSYTTAGGNGEALPNLVISMAMDSKDPRSRVVRAANSEDLTSEEEDLLSPRDADPALAAVQWTQLNIAHVDNRTGVFALNGFGGYTFPIADTGALPCIITQAALQRIPPEQRPKVRSVHAPLQTVTGQIEHPIGETDPMEVTFTHPIDKKLIRRSIPFLVLRQGGYEVLLGMSLWKRLYATLDFLNDQVTVRQWQNNTNALTFNLHVWEMRQLVNTCQVFIPAYAGTLPQSAAQIPLYGRARMPSITSNTPIHVLSLEGVRPDWTEHDIATLPPIDQLGINVAGNTATVLSKATNAGNSRDESLALRARHQIQRTRLNNVWPLPHQAADADGGHFVRWTTRQTALTVVSLFSGIGTDLEGLLRAGFTVKHYWAVEVDATARAVCDARLEQLLLRFPKQLARTSIIHAHTRLAQDITCVTDEHLRQLGGVDLLISGWPCQGLSSAGKGEGFGDARSALFHEMERVLCVLQRHQTQPLGYLLENVYAGKDTRPSVRSAWAEVIDLFGQPFVVDAAQLDSFAHRVRAFWTNLIPTDILQRVLSVVERTPHLYVDSILENGRRSSRVTTTITPPPPYYACDGANRPRQALPTFVSFPNSHAYRIGQPGRVWDPTLRKWDVPNAQEREVAMGFQPGTTQVRGVGEVARRQLLGQVMDLNTVTWILEIIFVHQSVYSPALLCSVIPPPIINYDSLEAVSLQQELQEPLRAFAAVSTEKHEWTLGKELQPSDHHRLQQLLTANRDCFAWSAADLGVYTGPPMLIETKTTTPVWRKQYRLSATEAAVIGKKTQELLDAKLVVESVTNHGYAAPTVLPPKRDAAGKIVDWRMCGDYRALNTETITDHYPMTTPDEIFMELAGSVIFTSLDLKQGFNQILMHPDHRHKTAFWAGNRLVEWLVMPFGLKNAPAKFQRVMDHVLRGLTTARCYIDDILIYSDSVANHLLHLQEVFDRLREVNLKCHPGKCVIGVSKVLYLGHLIQPGALSPQQAKIQAILVITPPTNVSEVRQFLGLVGYYRRFIPTFSTIAHPLNQLLRKETEWEWTPARQDSFDELKTTLIENPVLRLPDKTKPYALHTDWSMKGLGAVLSQADSDGAEYAIAYASRSNNTAESNYSSYHGELLAVVWAVRHFRPYLYGVHFTLYTDHQPLQWLMTNNNLTGKLARWTLILQEYDFTIIHKPGTANSNADVLSRNPLPSSFDHTDARQDEDAPAAAPLFVVTRSQSARMLPDRARPQPSVFVKQGYRTIDPWANHNLLTYIQTGVLSQNMTIQESEWTQVKSRLFVWRQGRLLLNVRGREPRVIPQLDERTTLIWNLHRKLGHWGQARTLSLLQAQYWWPGMQGQVRSVLQHCSECDMLRDRTLLPSPVQLQSIPITGLFYRWSLDTAGPFPISRRGNQYILVMVEHFSKWLELVTLPLKESKYTSEAFLHRVLTMYGAPAEVLTDQGTEFHGEFQTQLEESLIDHRETSRNHPQADGLAERSVQSIKVALKKYCTDINRSTWDVQLPWIAMGYRFSVQASLGYSPYYLLFGRHPGLPGSALLHAAPPEVTPDALANLILDRANIFRRIMPLAVANLKAAQHRDQLWYSRRRTGRYTKTAFSFRAGDYVYVRKVSHNILDAAIHQPILQIVQVLDTGVLELKGEDGQITKEHMKNCQPCHLPLIEPSPTRMAELHNHPDLYLTLETNDLSCAACARANRDEPVVLCTICKTLYHVACLPPLMQASVQPEWSCYDCNEVP